MPDLRPGDLIYYDAFQFLTGARSYNMGGPNPLSVADMTAYVTTLTILEGVDARRRFVRFMQEMDRTYLEFAAEKAEQRRATTRPKTRK